MFKSSSAFVLFTEIISSVSQYVLSQDRLYRGQEMFESQSICCICHERGHGYSRKDSVRQEVFQRFFRTCFRQYCTEFLQYIFFQIGLALLQGCMDIFQCIYPDTVFQAVLPFTAAGCNGRMIFVQKNSFDSCGSKFYAQYTIFECHNCTYKQIVSDFR